MVDVGNTLNLYDKMDQDIPWKTLKIQNIDTKNVEIGQRLGQITVILLNIEDAHFRSQLPVYEWCSFAEGILTTYVKLISSNASTVVSKRFALNVFDKFLQTMNKTVSELETISTLFNEASENINLLQSQLNAATSNGRNTDIESYYNDLKVRIDQSTMNLESINKSFRTEIMHIGKLKAEIDTTETPDNINEELRDDVKNSAQPLIAKCTRYIELHKLE